MHVCKFQVNALLRSRERELSTQMNQAAALDAGVAEEDESAPEGSEEAEEGAQSTRQSIYIYTICFRIESVM